MSPATTMLEQSIAHKAVNEDLEEKPVEMRSPLPVYEKEEEKFGLDDALMLDEAVPDEEALVLQASDLLKRKKKKKKILLPPTP